MRTRLLAYAIKYRGNYQKIKNAIETNEQYDIVPYTGTFITIVDDNYPKRLLQLKQPPYVLFYEGDLSLLKTPMLAVIGSRTMSDTGRRYCELLIQNINQKYTILSGMAKGIDGYIHALALQKHATVAIVGCGLDICYPKVNTWLYQVIKQEHLMLSEYPAQTKPLAHHFPMRNRLLAALCEKVVVIEAKQRSGTFLTVNEALLLDRDIYCFPSIFDEFTTSGCNVLIQEGANIIVDIESLKEL